MASSSIITPRYMEAKTVAEFRDYKVSSLIGALAMILLCFVGCYTNLISFCIFRQKSMRSSINVLLGALSLIDVVVIITSVPVFVVPALNEFFRYEILEFGYEISILYIYPITLMAQTCSVWTFVLISLERFYAVCYPFDSKYRLTAVRAKMWQLVVVVSSVLYNLVRFWEYELNNTLPPKALENSTYSYSIIDKVNPLLKDNYFYFLGYYLIGHVLTHFVLPFSIILILNVCIVVSMRRARHLQQILLNGTYSSYTSTTRMAISVTSVFFLCNLCSLILHIWEVFAPDLFYEKPTSAFLLLDLSNATVLLNTSINFVIYLIYSKKYRQRFRLGSILCRSFSDRNIRFNNMRRNGTTSIPIPEFQSVPLNRRRTTVILNRLDDEARQGSTVTI